MQWIDLNRMGGVAEGPWSGGPASLQGPQGNPQDSPIYPPPRSGPGPLNPNDPSWGERNMPRELHPQPPGFGPGWQGPGSDMPVYQYPGVRGNWQDVGYFPDAGLVVPPMPGPRDYGVGVGQEPYRPPVGGPPIDVQPEDAPVQEWRVHPQQDVGANMWGGNWQTFSGPGVSWPQGGDSFDTRFNPVYDQPTQPGGGQSFGERFGSGDWDVASQSQPQFDWTTQVTP